MALDLQSRLTLSNQHLRYLWMAPVKDILNAVVWLFAIFGNHIEWRGEHFRLLRDGRLEKR
jgi:hypothetical protein